MADLNATVSGWLTDLNGLVTQAVEIKQQINGPAATSPVTVQTQSKPTTGLSTGMIAASVIGLILVVVVVKKVL